MVFDIDIYFHAIVTGKGFLERIWISYTQELNRQSYIASTIPVRRTNFDILVNVKSLCA
jgi:hypothetical protein